MSECPYCQEPSRYGLLPSEQLIGHREIGVYESDDNPPVVVKGHKPIHPVAAVLDYYVACQEVER